MYFPRANHYAFFINTLHTIAESQTGVDFATFWMQEVNIKYIWNISYMLD